jgi:hypothetical protein
MQGYSELVRIALPVPVQVCWFPAELLEFFLDEALGWPRVVLPPT